MLPWGKVILGSGAAAFILFALRQVQKIVSGYNQLPAIEYSNNNNSVSTYVHYGILIIYMHILKLMFKQMQMHTKTLSLLIGALNFDILVY